MQQYLQKRALYPPLIQAPPKVGLGLVVTIPCHNEPDLESTLRSIAACDLPTCAVEVIVCINAAANASEAIQQQNQNTFENAKNLVKTLQNSQICFHILHFSDLPPKHAGVGLARKIAMDEAVRRLIENPKAAIACLDADTLVQPNYLCVLHDFFSKNPGCQAAGIYYEHPIASQESAATFETSKLRPAKIPALLNPKTPKLPNIYTAITAYELHLRYYVHALRWAGLPTATQTVGSAMAVRAEDYCAQGGMNRRKAGEDFYFIHKFTPLGGFQEITETTIIPSPRISDRVPFGTGKAVGEMLSGAPFLSYSPFIFKDLKHFLALTQQFYLSEKTEMEALKATLPTSVSLFLQAEDFTKKLDEIRQNTTSAEAFTKRFFRWFDAFRAMKFVHFARDGFYPNLPIAEAACGWLEMASCVDFRGEKERNQEQDLLGLFRAWDKLPELAWLP